MGLRHNGNAIQTINYLANGEASDWMLGKHGIISFSPELGGGSGNPATDNFYPPQKVIS